MGNEVNGTVELVRKDQRGFKLADNGQWYSVRSGTLSVKLSKGDKVKLSYTQNGQYNNIDSLELTSKSQVQPGNSVGTSTVTQREDPAGKVLGCVSAITCSYIQYVKDMKLAGKEVSDDIPMFIDTISISMVNAYMDIKQEIERPKIPVQTGTMTMAPADSVM